MALLIEEIMKVSALAAFLFDSLASNKHPNCLSWVKIEEFRVCLNCLHKKKKGYTEEEEKLFKDYVAFTGKPIKTTPRSAFLQAMRASPYVAIDKKNSTHDVKFFVFTDKFQKLLEKCVHETNGESNLQPNSFDVPSTSAMADLTEVVALEEAPTVPDIHISSPYLGLETFNTPPSFYAENDNLRTANLQAGSNANSIGIPQEPQPNACAENPYHTLPPEEQSMDLNCPENYDPSSDLIQSWRRNSNAVDNSLMPGTPYKIHDVCSVKMEGNVVRKIYDEEPQPSSQKHYFLTIGPSF